MEYSQIKIGAVVKYNGEFFVITAVDYQNETCTFLAFYDNILRGAPFKPLIEEHLCSCVINNISPLGCSVCGGEGSYKLSSPLSMEQFEFVAKNIRDYLIKRYVD